MRILAIGDLHGRIPNLRSLVNKEKPDVIICTGDFAGDEGIRKLIFKNWGRPWYWGIGMKRARQMFLASVRKGKKILRYLNSLKTPVYFVPGNNESKDSYKRKYKNIHCAHMRKFRISGRAFIFHGGYLDAKIFFDTKILGETAKSMSKRKKENDSEKKKISKLFKNEKNAVFVTHMIPYKLFDKVKNKQSPMNNRHVGIGAYRDVILKYKPALYICGHMHENQGVSRIGRTKAICLGMGDKNVFIIKLNGGISISKRKL